MTEWPWPGDTALDRARRIARSLLALLPEAEQPVWAARAAALGETWLTDRLMLWSADDVVSTKEAAEIVQVGPATIRKWHSLGYLAAQARGRYRVGDVIDCAAERRRGRAEHAT